MYFWGIRIAFFELDNSANDPHKYIIDETKIVLYFPNHESETTAPQMHMP